MLVFLTLGMLILLILMPVVLFRFSAMSGVAPVSMGRVATVGSDNGRFAHGAFNWFHSFIALDYTLDPTV